jgi:hypothetical protein
MAIQDGYKRIKRYQKVNDTDFKLVSYYTSSDTVDVVGFPLSNYFSTKFAAKQLIIESGENIYYYPARSSVELTNWTGTHRLEVGNPVFNNNGTSIGIGCMLSISVDGYSKGYMVYGKPDSNSKYVVQSFAIKELDGELYLEVDTVDKNNKCIKEVYIKIDTIKEGYQNDSVS